MTTYNSAAVSNTAIAFQKPITLQQGRALRDNPIAVTEGQAAAPKNQLASIERLTAGTSVRLQTDTLTATAADFEVSTVSFALNMVQGGTARFHMTFSGSPSPTASLVRTRARVSVTLHSTAVSPMSFDTTVLPGDVFIPQVGASGVGVGSSVTATAQIRTDGTDLWPGPGMFGYIEGNAAFP